MKIQDLVIVLADDVFVKIWKDHDWLFIGYADELKKESIQDFEVYGIKPRMKDFRSELLIDC